MLTGTINDTATNAWSNDRFMHEIAEYFIDHRLTDKLCLAIRRTSIDELYDGETFVENNYDGFKYSRVTMYRVIISVIF